MKRINNGYEIKNELKDNGGKFDATTKTWTIDDVGFDRVKKTVSKRDFRLWGRINWETV